MYSRHVIILWLTYFALQQSFCEARRRRNFHVSESFTYDAKVKVYGSTLTTTIDVIHITEPEEVLEVEVARGSSYGGGSVINLYNGAIAIKAKTSGSCSIQYNQAENVKRKRKAIIKMLKDAKNKKDPDVLPGIVCKTHGNIRMLSPYGNRIITLCHNLYNNNLLTNFCRYATDEENEAYNSNCDVGFVYVNDNVELGCVRAWH